MTAISFTVIGKPQPGGSKKAFPVNGRCVITDANPKAKPWKQLVAAAARESYAGAPLTGPVHLTAMFYRERPKSHYGTGRNADVLKATAPAYPCSAPDALKLARLVEDSLTGLLYKDDAQIVSETLVKLYGRPERVEVVVGTVG